MQQREMLDHLHSLAHYIKRGGHAQLSHDRDAGQLVFRIAVEPGRYWRIVSETQEIRDAVRRGRYTGVLLTDRPIDLVQYDDPTTRWLVRQHLLLGDMLVQGEPMFIWTTGATTGRGRFVEIRRYAYDPEEFGRRLREAGIVPPTPPATTKRDQLSWWRE